MLLKSAPSQSLILLLLVFFSSASCARSEPDCPPANGAALQVLGSGGPIADDGRASSGYIVWVDGVSRVLIDAGGGTFLRFGESGADFAGLDFIGLSHLHTDHSADFPALLKSGSFSGRKRALDIAGPDADGPFPGVKAWLRSLLDSESGAYGYLSGFLDGTAGRPMLAVKEIGGDASVTVYKNASVVVEAMHVPHGIVPAIAFKVRAGDETFVFASDQNGSNAAFAEFAIDASILVMHLVVPEDISGVGRRLHAPPSVVGEIAGRSGARKLVLSHFMGRSLTELDKNVELVRSGYPGEIILAEDLACVVP
ncbi:MAG: MBL fold metallo-hydrolase [Woeseiaceae bacterium]